jgi:hypothetical protein
MFLDIKRHFEIIILYGKPEFVFLKKLYIKKTNNFVIIFKINMCKWYF